MSIHPVIRRADRLVFTLASLALLLIAPPSNAQSRLQTTSISTNIVTATPTTSSTPSSTPSSTTTWTSTVLTDASLSDFELSIAPAPPCDDATRARILEEAGPGNDAIEVDCSFSIAPPERITKRLVFSGSTQGVTVDCHGAAIDGGPGRYLYDAGDRGTNIVEIRSTLDGGTGPASWVARPQNITIRDCEIVGSARIWPLNFWDASELARLRSLSRQPGYVSTLRSHAPRGIRFERVTFRAQKTTPLYIGPGVTETTVVDSWFLGEAQGVALYLDAESSRNHIRGNQFHTQTDRGKKPREVVAIDGSDHNEFVDNWFSALDHGGIELYRNCGEDAVVRFTTPSHNRIINNVFYYDRYDGSEAAVVLGSRDGQSRDYCGDDSDFAGGSGTDDRSFATHNVVLQNQFYKRSVAQSVVTKWHDVNVPNYVAYNETVQIHEERPAGCSVDSAYGQFLRDGETTRLAMSSTGPSCSDQVLRCHDGEVELESPGLSGCAIRRIPFSCSVSGSDRGCSGSTQCPSGTTRVRVAAACNLEYGPVSSTQVAAIATQSVRVVRASDRVADGNCWVGSSALASGEAIIEDDGAGGRIYFGCSEHDENGGDCEIRGELDCQDDFPTRVDAGFTSSTFISSAR
ncbi:MAG: right-handed parallel beta-helix repeat-containing protein [Myxococcota bacterium]